MKILIKKYSGPSETILTSRKDIFFSLCKSIIGQQIGKGSKCSILKNSKLNVQIKLLFQGFKSYK